MIQVADVGVGISGQEGMQARKENSIAECRDKSEVHVSAHICAQKLMLSGLWKCVFIVMQTEFCSISSLCEVSVVFPVGKKNGWGNIVDNAFLLIWHKHPFFQEDNRRKWWWRVPIKCSRGCGGVLLCSTSIKGPLSRAYVGHKINHC